MGGGISGQSPWRRSRRVEAGPDPAAGVDWSFTVPGGRLWQIISAFAVLVTDATVADRAARLVVGDGTSTILSLAPAGVQVASLTYRYAWITAGVAYQTANGQVAALPRLILPPGYTVGASTENLAAGDNWGVPQLYVIETDVRGGPVDLERVPELYVEVVTPAAE